MKYFAAKASISWSLSFKIFKVNLSLLLPSSMISLNPFDLTKTLWIPYFQPSMIFKNNTKVNVKIRWTLLRRVKKMSADLEITFWFFIKIGPKPKILSVVHGEICALFALRQEKYPFSYSKPLCFLSVTLAIE